MGEFDARRQHCIDALEAGLGSRLDSVLHRRVALLLRFERHRLRQLGTTFHLLELERLQMVLERLHEPLRSDDLAVLALDRAVGGAEAPPPARAYVHLLDDGAVAPPLWDQLRIRPYAKDVLAGRVEDPLDPNLVLVRRRHLRLHRSPFVRSTTCAKRSSRCSHVVIPSKAYGASVQTRARPTFSVTTRPASSRTRTCFFIPVSEMPNGAARSPIVAGPDPSRSTTARRVGSPRAANALSIY